MLHKREYQQQRQVAMETGAMIAVTCKWSRCMLYIQERASQLECQRMLNEQADSGEIVMLPPLHPPHNALHSVSYLPHPCRETSISDASLTQTSSTVATLNGLDLIVAGVVVGRGCIRACHHPIIER